MFETKILRALNRGHPRWTLAGLVLLFLVWAFIRFKLYEDVASDTSVKSVATSTPFSTSATASTSAPIGSPATTPTTPATTSLFWSRCRVLGIKFLILREDSVRSVGGASRAAASALLPGLTHLSVLQGDAVKLNRLLRSSEFFSGGVSKVNALLARRNKSGVEEFLPLEKPVGSMTAFIVCGFVIFSEAVNRVEISILYEPVGVAASQGGYYFLPWSPRGRALLLPDLPVKQVVIEGVEGSFVMPKDVETFLWEMEAAEFASCRSKRIVDFRERVKKAAAGAAAGAAAASSQGNSTNDEKRLRLIVELRREMSLRRKRSWLFGRTLLAWYADCSLDPFDGDVHVAQWIDDYEDASIAEFSNHARLKKISTLGRRADGLEITLRDEGSTALHLHLLYHWKGKAWMRLFDSEANVRDRKRIAKYPAIGRICSADLRGRLVYVPCDPWSILRADYGDLPWSTDNAAFDGRKEMRNVQKIGP